MLVHKQHLPSALPCNLTCHRGGCFPPTSFVNTVISAANAITCSQGRNQLVLKLPSADLATLLHTNLGSSEPS